MRVDFQIAELKAMELIASQEITEPVVPVFDIAKSLGLTLKFVKMPDELKEASGFLHKATKTIYINNDDPLTRQAFTVAHELGHYVLNHEDKETKILWRNTHEPQGPLEQEANKFAAYLLVPPKFLEKIMHDFGLTKNDVNLLARMFGVSQEMMKNRLKWI